VTAQQIFPQILWRAADAAQATMGKALVDWNATGVSIDTRTLAPGDLFIAIKGPNFDGHNYVAAALAEGAAASMVACRPDGVGEDAPLLQVADTFAGLNFLGEAGRERSSAKIIAVTGSVGKTGVKEALGQLLSRQGETSFTQGSLNNHFGVPLSLARLPLEADYAVFELGMNHAGELMELSYLVRPLVSVITTVEPAHMEFFDSVADIAKAKAEIFAGLQPGGMAILNRDNPHFKFLADAAYVAGANQVIGFGEHDDADFRLAKYELAEASSRVEASFDGHSLSYRLSLPGRHWVQNSLAILAAVHSVGGDLFTAAEAISEIAPPKGRGGRHKIDLGEGVFDLIDDSYNASPVSIAAALEVLAGSRPGPSGRRIAVLGDMLELGENSKNFHRGLAQNIEACGVDLVFTTGDMMRHLHDALPKEATSAWVPSTEEILPMVIQELRAGDVVLVKGSAGSKMGQIVSHLLNSKGGG